MSTVYAINDPAAMTSLDVSSADKLFVHDASAGVTKVATVYDLMSVSQAAEAVSSNGAALSGSIDGLATMGTSTAVVLSAPTRAGITKVITSGTSTVAYTITASGSSFGTGTVWTQLGGGSVFFGAVSTSRWAIGPFVAHGSTLMA